MENFDLRKYLAEGRLLNENNDASEANIQTIAKTVQTDSKMDNLVDKAIAKVQNDPKAMDALNKLASMYGLDGINEINASDLDSIKNAAEKFALTLKEDSNDDASFTASGFLGGPLMLMLLGPSGLDVIYQFIMNSAGIDITTSFGVAVVGSMVAGVLIGRVLDKIANKRMNEAKKTPPTKISKSALKEMIKAAMLGEAKKDEEEVDTEAEDTEEVDIEAGAEETAGPELSGDVKTISDSLETALEAARAMGDEKLVNQIGNTITFFTRAHIVGGGEGSMGLEEMDNLENEEY